MTPRRALFAILAALLVVTVGQLHAAGPAAIMLYGSSLQKPVIIAGSSAGVLVYDYSIERSVNTGVSIPDLDFLYPTSVRDRQLDLSRRPFLTVALFWGGDFYEKYVPGRLTELKAETANQHVRLYLPAAGKPAVAVSTSGFVCSAPSVVQWGSPVPIPSDISGFPCGRLLGETDLATLRRLGVPGF